MFDVKEFLDGVGRQVSPPSDVLERVAQSRDRRRRNRRIGAAAMAFAVAVAAIGYLWLAARGLDQKRPADPDTTKITASNVAQLRVAWHAPDLGILPAIAEGMAFVDQGNIGDASIRAYPLTCRSDGGACDATWAVDHFGWQNPAFVADGFVFQIGGPGHDPFVAAFATDCGVAGERCAPTWRGPLHALNKDADIQYSQMGFSAGNGGVFVRLADRLYRFPVACAENNATCSPTWVTQEFRSVVSSDDRVLARSSRGIAMFEADCFAARGPRCPRLWSARPSGGQIVDPMMAISDEFFVVAAGRLLAYPADCGAATETCSPDWSAPADFPTQLPLVTDGASVFVVSNGQVGGFEGSCRPVDGICTPTILSTTNDLVLQAPAISDGLLFVPSLGKSKSTITAFEIGCSSCDPAFTWQTPGAGAIQTTLQLVGNTLLVVSGSELYALQPLPNGRVPQTLTPLLLVPMLAVAGGVLILMLIRKRRRHFV